MRNFILEGKKIARPVLFTTCLLTLLTCILSCTLYREYTIHFELDPWEIGTEFLSLLFPLFVTVPICWQLYYERRDHFLTYTLPRISRRRYLTAKWGACAAAAFIIIMIPYFVSALFALYVRHRRSFGRSPWLRPCFPGLVCRNAGSLCVIAFYMEGADGHTDNDAGFCTGSLWQQYIRNPDRSVYLCHFGEFLLGSPWYAGTSFCDSL